MSQPDEIKADELAVDGPPLFIIRGATISCHPNDAIAVGVSDDATNIKGILQLKGWDRQSAGIVGCRLTTDADVPPGSLVVRPGW